jgi:23S rRNA (adenine2030-N6)-methyltransferase
LAQAGGRRAGSAAHLRRYHRGMFSYRHAFHAGNHADVLKHMTLIATLAHLTQKDAALSVIDTHAGAGLYRLDSDYADKSSEARDGVLKLFSHIRPAGVNSASKVPSALSSSRQSAIKPLVRESTGGAPASTTEALAPALLAYLDLVASFNPGGQL